MTVNVKRNFNPFRASVLAVSIILFVTSIILLLVDYANYAPVGRTNTEFLGLVISSIMLAFLQEEYHKNE